MAVESELIPVLVGEEVLDLPQTMGNKKVSDDLVVPASIARNSARTYVFEAQAQAAEAVSDVVRRRIANLMAIDRDFKIEEAILAVATGVGAFERVRASLCAMFPTREKEVKPETVLHNIACFRPSTAC